MACSRWVQRGSDPPLHYGHRCSPSHGGACTGSPVHHVDEIQSSRSNAQALLIPRPDPCHGSKYSVPTEQGMEERCCDVQQDGGEKHVGEQAGLWAPPDKRRCGPQVYGSNGLKDDVSSGSASALTSFAVDGMRIQTPPGRGQWTRYVQAIDPYQSRTAHLGKQSRAKLGLVVHRSIFASRVPVPTFCRSTQPPRWCFNRPP
jgi:hypothetical protein